MVAAVSYPDISDCSVSILVFTLNEELNINHCLDSLVWCDDVNVVDSFSSDNTVQICRARGIPTVQHVFEGFGTQRNWALREIPLKHDWVLILDADERVPEDLASELNSLAEIAPKHVDAYRLRRRLHLWGTWLRHSSLYPTWVVRFVRRNRVLYVNRGHSETQTVEGDIGELRGHLIDENHKALETWFERQFRYSRQEAKYELEAKGISPRWSDLISMDPMHRRAIIRKIASVLPCRGFFYFLYCYFFRYGFLDGKNGFMYCRMKAMYQGMIVINKYDLRKERDMHMPEKRKI